AGVVAQPDLLPLDADHALLDGLLEERTDDAAVVVAPDESNVVAVDQIAGVGRLLAAAHAEGADDPERVAASDAAVDGVEQFLVVMADGRVTNAPAAARLGRGQALLLGAEMWALAILDDVGVTQVQVGGEPDGHTILIPHFLHWTPGEGKRFDRA